MLLKDSYTHSRALLPLLSLLQATPLHHPHFPLSFVKCCSSILSDVFLCLWHLLHIVIRIAHTPRCTQMQSTLRIRLSTHTYTRTHTHAHTHAHSHTHVEEAATLKQLVKSKNALHTKLFRCNEAVNARQQLSPHPFPSPNLPRSIPQ